MFYLKHKAPQIMNIYQLNKYVTCILMYRHNRGMLPNIFNDMFIKHTTSHNYNMRQQNSLQNTTLQKQYQTMMMIVYEYFQKGNETIYLKNILTRNTGQLGYSGIIQYNTMNK